MTLLGYYRVKLILVASDALGAAAQSLSDYGKKLALKAQAIVDREKERQGIQ